MTRPADPPRGLNLSIWTWLKLAVIALALIGLAVFGLAIVAALAAAGAIAFFIHRLFGGGRRPWDAFRARRQPPERPSPVDPLDGTGPRRFDGPVIDADYKVEPTPGGDAPKP